MRKTSKTIVGAVDSGVLSFTAGDDSICDQALVRYDCLGTAAHVRMLAAIKSNPPVISRAECRKVLKVLSEIIDLSENGRFSISDRDQDVHMAVEACLTRKLGDVGRKIHTARSRNDQAALDMRMYMRAALLDAVDSAALLAKRLLDFAHRHRGLMMAGRTHFMPAMPSSVGLWAASYAEAIVDDAKMMQAAYAILNRSPLGSAASYGVPLAIDRQLTAKLLGFEGPVNNVLYAGSSRGKVEAMVLSCCSMAMLTLSKLAEDVIIFSSPEFGYFELPDEMCTGSSIMPQKKNPDVMELIRARASVVKGCCDTVFGVVAKLPAGYSRDLQETKEPAMRGLRVTSDCMKMAALIFAGVKCRKSALKAGLAPEIFATDLALKYVMEGMPFRSAYDRVKAELKTAGMAERSEFSIETRCHAGAAGNLGLDLCRADVRRMIKWQADAVKMLKNAERNLFKV